MTKKQKLNLIEELTTHKNDFQIWPLHPVEPKSDVRPREEPVVKVPSPHVQIDPQSHAPYLSSIHVPFDLYLAPKPIVGKDPRECFKLNKSPYQRSSYENMPDAPILSPALPLDQIEEKKDLKKILEFTYTGMHKILMNEAALKIPKRPNPPHQVRTEMSDIRFKSDLYPPLPPGWIAAARHWDCLQSRNLGDPTKTFWKRRGPEVECSCCCNALPNMLSEETKEQIKVFSCEGKLRLPYTSTKTGYSGYRQICAKGVPLEKSN